MGFLDQFITKYYYNKGYDGERRFSLKDTFSRKSFNQRRSKILCVVIPHWGEKEMATVRLEKNLKKEKIPSVFFSLQQEILFLHYADTKKVFRLIRNAIVRDIKHLKRKYGYERVILIGFSAGCVAAILAANRSRDINEVILVAPVSNAAESMWYGIRTQALRKNYVAHKIKLKDIQRSWKSLEPINNLKNLKNKKVFLLLSRGDDVAPYRYGARLFRKIKQTGCDVRARVNSYLGHYGTVLSFILYPKELYESEDI